MIKNIILYFHQHFIRAVFYQARKRYWEAISHKKITSYLNRHQIKKLQLGSQDKIISGWLNTDNNLKSSKELVFLDITKKFPFSDKTFDYIFLEHLIEHVSYEQGLFCFSECLRVLKEGGKIRVATPNLKFLFNLLRDNRSNEETQFISWANKNYKLNIINNSATFVINSFFYSWGHRFIYDADTLKQSLITNGFNKIKFCTIGKSEDPNLNNLERHYTSDNDREMVKLETIILEAQK